MSLTGLQKTTELHNALYTESLNPRMCPWIERLGLQKQTRQLTKQWWQALPSKDPSAQSKWFWCLDIFSPIQRVVRKMGIYQLFFLHSRCFCVCFMCGTGTVYVHIPREQTRAQMPIESHNTACNRQTRRLQYGSLLTNGVKYNMLSRGLQF